MGTLFFPATHIDRSDRWQKPLALALRSVAEPVDDPVEALGKLFATAFGEISQHRGLRFQIGTLQDICQLKPSP